MTRRALLVACAALVGALTACGGSAPAPSPSPASASVTGSAVPDLLGTVDGPGPDVPDTSSRTRYATVDERVLLDEQGEPRSAEIRLELFPDTVYTASLTFENLDGIEQWTGAVDGVAESTVTVVRVGSVLSAQVASPEGVYQVSPTADDRYLVTEVDQTAFPTDAEPPG